MLARASALTSNSNSLRASAIPETRDRTQGRPRERSGWCATTRRKPWGIHRLLQQHGLSNITGTPSLPEEKRSFGAEFAGSIWYGDVMHGPRLALDGQMRKTYLVSLFDDASRLLTHSAFCLGETALDIEGVLKQALLRRGIPIKLVLDNGAAYRAATLQALCARLGTNLQSA